MYSRKELGIFLYSIYIRLSKNIYYFINKVVLAVHTDLNALKTVDTAAARINAFI